MIIDPSPSALIRTVSNELRTTLATAISDPGLTSLVLMMSAVLDTAAIRTDHESTWMIEESQQIEHAASDLAASLPDQATLRATLDSYLAFTSPAAGPVDDRSAYLHAGILLSAALTAAQDHPEHFTILESLVATRVEREAIVVGGVALVGRS